MDIRYFFLLSSIKMRDTAGLKLKHSSQLPIHSTIRIFVSKVSIHA